MKRIFLFGGLALCSVLLMISLVLGGVLFYLSRDLPNLIEPKDYTPWLTTEVFSNDGVKIGEFLEQRRYLVESKDIPDLLRKAFVASEDGDFYHHKGISWEGIFRSAMKNVSAGKFAQGGSTITQQVARSLLLTKEKTIVRKLKEWILASRMERRFTKDDILFFYLNQIYLGHGAYGVEAASLSYFGKSMKDLELQEMAILAGLPQAPSTYSPINNARDAKRRQIYVLRRMVDEGYIKESQMLEALKKDLRIRILRPMNDIIAPHYLEHVRRTLLGKIGKDSIYRDGLKVKTNMNFQLQKVAQDSLKKGLAELDKRRGFRGPTQKLKQADIKAFLEHQYTSLQGEYNDYRIIKGASPGVIEHFLKNRYLDTESLTHVEAELEHKNVHAQDLVEVGQVYDAVITQVKNFELKAQILPDLEVHIPIQGSEWARLVEKDKYNEGGPISNFNDTKLAFGDVVKVKLSAKMKVNPQTKEVETLAKLDQIPEVQGALLSIDLKTNNVISMVGGYDYRDSQFNRAMQSLRQPGSTFKPAIYLSALLKGMNASTTLYDNPLVYETDEDKVWKPQNYTETFYGDISLIQALIHSRNVPTVKLLETVGIDFSINVAKILGISSALARDLSLSLGSSGVSLWELTHMYGIFANQGRRVRGTFLDSVVDRHDTVLMGKQEELEAHKAREKTYLASAQGRIKEDEKQFYEPIKAFENPDQVIDPAYAALMANFLRNVVIHGTAQKASVLPMPVAGKTGTTTNYVDAWFVGFSPSIVTGVWVGFDKEMRLGRSETGAEAALPIWKDYMAEAGKIDLGKDFEVPAGVKLVGVDERTGKLFKGQVGQSKVIAAYLDGTEPSEDSQKAEDSSYSRDDF